MGSRTTWNIAYEDRPQIGFMSSLHLYLWYSKSISARMDLNYFHTSHDIVYRKSVGPPNVKNSDANYTLSTSTFQFAPILKYTSHRLYIFAGPYIDLKCFKDKPIKGDMKIYTSSYMGPPSSEKTLKDGEIEQDVRETFGYYYGVGFNPLLFENRLHLELKFAKSFTDVVQYPNVKQSTASLRIIFLLTKPATQVLPS